MVHAFSALLPPRSTFGIVFGPLAEFVFLRQLGDELIAHKQHTASQGSYGLFVRHFPSCALEFSMDRRHRRLAPMELDH